MKNNLLKKKYSIILFLIITFLIISIFNRSSWVTITDQQTVSLLESLKKDPTELYSDSETIFFESTVREKIISLENENIIVKIPSTNSLDQINNLKIGDSIQKVIAENGKEIYFYGFEWDGSGLVYDWNHGDFNSNYFSVKLRIDSAYNEYVLTNLLGDHQLYSGSLDLSKVDIVVDEITFRFD